MPTILDFQIQPLSAESYSLNVCERGSSGPLARSTFQLRVDFLTDFSVDRLNASTQDAAERFDKLKEKGQELYRTLFTPNVHRCWREYQQRSEFLILCLRFAEDANKLEVLPWETLYDADNDEFIAAGKKTTLTRLPIGIDSPDALPLIPRPLKLFGFFASPLDLQDHERLNSEREQEILLEAINDPAGQGSISADFEDEAKLEILERSLKDGYHILHFTGHGISPRGGGGLLLEDAYGKKLPVSVVEVMQAVQRGQDGNAKLRLAVISGCQTSRTLHTQGFNDLARELLRQRVPAVIAMQFSISDEGGLKFAEVLYREIAKGVALEPAVHAARRVLLEDKRFRINNDALAIVLLAADGACLQTTAAESLPPQAEASATYLGDRLDPLAHGFYGRRREYRKIRDALLHQGQRAAIIHGIGGIGKTALLTHAINRLRPRFKDVMSFDCRRAALAPETILLELSRYFEKQGMPQLQSLIGQNEPPETLANVIAKLLIEWPLLIVFDNFESQLDEQRKFINEDLCVFLTTLVRATMTGSRFLFTTRYLFDLDGERLGNVQALPLGDLSRAEALMLMQKLPTLTRAALRHKDAAMEKFGKHPKAIVLLNDYCNHQPLGQALQDASSLQSELREFLAIELNYQRLSDRAREMLYRLATFRTGVPFAAAEWVMREEFIAPSPGETINVVRELIDWGLLTPQIEGGELQSLTVHCVTRDFCRNQQPRETWRERLRNAAKFFFKDAQFIQQDNKSADTVWSEMEAFELLMEVEDFEDATRIVLGAHILLDRWGFDLFVAEQYRRLSEKLDGRALATILHNQAVTMLNRGEYGTALAQWQRSLALFEDIGSRKGMQSSLHQIGRIYEKRGEYGAAVEQYQRSLAIAAELGDRASVARSQHHLGSIHQKRGEHKAAVEQYRQSQAIFEELGDRASVATSLHQIGKIHQKHERYEAALEQYQQSLAINVELGDQAGLATSLGLIGIIHYECGDYVTAVEQYRQALTIFEELGNRAGVASLLHQIGMTYLQRKDYSAAVEQYQRSLAISQELDDRAGVACSLHEIGRIHQARGEYEAALEQYQQSLAIEEELGNRVGVAVSQHQIGELFIKTEHYAKAFNLLLSALAMFVELQLPDAEVAVNDLRTLRAKWGVVKFDAAWLEATGEDVPKWLMDKPEATAS